VASLILSAQQPSHFILGEEELSGIDIYHIIQDNSENYWLATNQGVIKFDGYTFKTIRSKKMLSSSVFDLQMDYNNVIHFKNLSGQIFKIKNDSCILRIQIPDSLMSSQVYYSFDNNNNIVVATNTIFKITKNNKIEFYKHYSDIKWSYAQPTILKDSSIIIHSTSANELHTIKNDSINRTPLTSVDKDLFIQSFYLDNKLYYYDRKTGKIAAKIEDFTSNDSCFTPIKNIDEYFRYYAENTSFWIARQGGGVNIFNKDFSARFNNNTVFDNHIISSFLKDKEGNIILGTFGEGLIVITNLELTEIKLPDNDAKITRVTSAQGNNIFLGTQNGRIYRIDSTHHISLFRDKEFKNIEVLEYIKETQELLINEKRPTFINLSTGKIRQHKFGAIKDVIRINSNKYLIASNEGVSIFIPNNNTSPRIILDNFRERTYSVHFNPLTNSIYAGTSQGLKIGNKKNAAFYTLNDKPIICKDILYFDENIYITTKNNGVLIFKNDSLIDQWKGKNDSYMNTVRFIKSYNQQLFLSTNYGVHILNYKGEILKTISKSEGLYSTNIIDFEIINDVLWLVTQKGVQPINIKDIKPHDFHPRISFNQILINEVRTNISDNPIFNYDQNKFEFIVSAKNIRFSNEIKYKYILQGLDKEWQVNSYYDNNIIYKSLPPGQYTFKIKSFFRNNESNLLNYSFTIKPPFWATWWFYSIIALAFIIITYIVFKIQIEKHRKRIQIQNELNASKLIAIQSQMNPHFIFNAINSIQDLILKGDIDNSYSYIIKFSKLVRQTLNFSDKEFIDIEEEIELLEIYLELEKLRFKDDFEYSINCDIEDIKVPPMLIQPFVENAIKHGLLHKDGLKKLAITFAKNEILHCTITDNGVGRKKAQEIKARQHKNHQSFSVNATRSRFEIMKSHYQQDLGVAYEDLITNGEATGTKVIINMPFKQNY
jgi:ligand-binding sensor domain-containing protein